MLFKNWKGNNFYANYSALSLCFIPTMSLFFDVEILHIFYSFLHFMQMTLLMMQKVLRRGRMTIIKKVYGWIEKWNYAYFYSSVTVMTTRESMGICWKIMAREVFISSPVYVLLFQWLYILWKLFIQKFFVKNFFTYLYT